MIVWGKRDFINTSVLLHFKFCVWCTFLSLFNKNATGVSEDSKRLQDYLDAYRIVMKITFINNQRKKFF